MPQLTLNSADIDPLDTDARRQYMNVFFGQLPISLDIIQEARVKAVELQSKHLAGQGLREVSEIYFEYHVDVTIWRLIVKRLMITKYNPWPWNVSLDENNLSQGTSSVFREWCQSQADPPSRDQGPVPRSQGEAEQMALEAFQRAKDFELEGFRLQLIARQWPSEDETPPRDLHSGRPRTYGAPDPSSSDGNIHADDPSDLSHVSDGSVPPDAPWNMPWRLEDTKAGRGILRRIYRRDLR